MKINADFSQRVVMHFAQNDWVASPAAGVERKMLDRIGEEVARATTIVRFAPGSAFSAHTHDGGEEYLVLDGTFEDEYGDFPVGSYVRNPPTSRHTPAASKGATILVKLHQFDPADRHQVAVDTVNASWEADATRDGVSTLALFDDGQEIVTLEHWAPGTTVNVSAQGGMEIFVLSGALSEGGDHLVDWDWMRLPEGYQGVATAGPDGAKIWVKRGHLAAEARRAA